MALYTVRTASDLSAAVGKFVRRQATFAGLLEINVAAGTLSLGILYRVYSIGAVQYGEVVAGQDLVQVLAGAAFAAQAILTNDAQGRAVVAGGTDDVMAVSTGAATGAGVLVYVQTFTQNDPNSSNTNPPTSPEIFVSSTGSDALSQPGTFALPLATVAEAIRRLSLGYLVSAFITVEAGTVNEGANPNWSFPVPMGGALPICLRTTYQVDVAGVAVTGGSAGTAVPPAPATITSADGSAANTQRGKILQFSPAGPGTIPSTRYIIDSNDGAGGFTLATQLGSAPAAGNAFDVVSRLGRVTWTGQLTVSGVFYNDGLDMLPTGVASAFDIVAGGTMYEYGTRWTSAAAQFRIQGDSDGHIVSGIVRDNGFYATGSLAPVPLPAGVTVCGCCVDGTLGTIGIGAGAINSSAQLAPSTIRYQGASMRGVDLRALGQQQSLSMFRSVLTDAGVVVQAGVVLGGVSALFSIVRITDGRKVVGSGSTAVIGVVSGGTANISAVGFVGTIADNLIQVDGSSAAQIGSCSGVPTTAAKLFVTITKGATAQFNAGNTATGNTVGLDVGVDAGTAFPVADATTMVIVGAQNGTFQHSTSDLTANPTINKFSGFAAVQLLATTCVITNSLADVGDHVDITPNAINATVAKYSAVATLNTITVTTDAAPTGAAWPFSFNLRKSTL